MFSHLSVNRVGYPWTLVDVLSRGEGLPPSPVTGPVQSSVPRPPEGCNPHPQPGQRVPPSLDGGISSARSGEYPPWPGQEYPLPPHDMIASAVTPLAVSLLQAHKRILLFHLLA